MKCPLCSRPGEKVIYAGFPMKLCTDNECRCLWGFWSFIPHVSFNGFFFTYEGSYLPALWTWLTGDITDDDFPDKGAAA